MERIDTRSMEERSEKEIKRIRLIEKKLKEQLAKLHGMCVLIPKGEYSGRWGEIVDSSTAYYTPFVDIRPYNLKTKDFTLIEDGCGIRVIASSHGGKSLKDAVIVKKPGCFEDLEAFGNILKIERGNKK